MNPVVLIYLIFNLPKTLLLFLCKGSLIKDMASGDPELEKTAYEQAGKVLRNDGEKTSQVSALGFNKSIINKYTDKGINNHPDKVSCFGCKVISSGIGTHAQIGGF